VGLLLAEPLLRFVEDCPVAVDGDWPVPMLHMPDRCFIALLSDWNTLLCERNGAGRGVGQDCGGHSYDEDTGTQHV
jgi:hypothetical protein